MEWHHFGCSLSSTRGQQSSRQWVKFNLIQWSSTHTHRWSSTQLLYNFQPKAALLQQLHGFNPVMSTPLSKKIKLHSEHHLFKQVFYWSDSLIHVKVHTLSPEVHYLDQCVRLIPHSETCASWEPGQCQAQRPRGAELCWTVKLTAHLHMMKHHPDLMSRTFSI